MQQHYLQVPDDLFYAPLPHVYALSDRLFQAPDVLPPAMPFTLLMTRPAPLSWRLNWWRNTWLNWPNTTWRPRPSRTARILPSIFLNESHRDIVHFASAGTPSAALLGIPARYGKRLCDQRQTPGSHSVPDRAAHAWGEIYLGLWLVSGG